MNVYNLTFLDIEIEKWKFRDINISTSKIDHSIFAHSSGDYGLLHMRFSLDRSTIIAAMKVSEFRLNISTVSFHSQE